VCVHAHLCKEMSICFLKCLYPFMLPPAEYSSSCSSTSSHIFRIAVVCECFVASHCALICISFITRVQRFSHTLIYVWIWSFMDYLVGIFFFTFLLSWLTFFLFSLIFVGNLYILWISILYWLDCTFSLCW
jgi:hypothetical protein